MAPEVGTRLEFLIFSLIFPVLNLFLLATFCFRYEQARDSFSSSLNNASTLFFFVAMFGVPMNKKRIMAQNVFLPFSMIISCRLDIFNV